MSCDASKSSTDLACGIALDHLPDGSMIVGRVGNEAVLLARRGDEVFAIGATCTHYGAPLGEGLLVGDTVRCPWHHATFCLRTGEVRRAPALDPVSCWRVEQCDGVVTVHEKLQPIARPASPAAPSLPETIIIVGGGAAGNAAAETLRHEGYAGRLTIFSADESVPCDRPNLSKGFLAGSAKDASNALRSLEFYEKHKIELNLRTRVAGIDTLAREVRLADESCYPYDALILATGAEPVRLDIPGANLPHVRYLRTLADSRALVARALTARRAVVIGASFIGLEVAASLRARGLGVDVVAPESVPMERILGRAVGTYIRNLHQDHGVTFHLNTTVSAIEEQRVVLASGEQIDADLVVVGIGVRPALALAEQAGLVIERGVTVDAFLRTSAPGVYAIGDIARWPDPLTGEDIRVEHWMVAERQGQAAARNVLGQSERFDCVPFFWTEQYDFSLGYVGHAERWDEAEIDGSLAARDCTITYWRAGQKLAVAVVHRDLEGVRAEVEFEREIARKTALLR